MKPLTVSLMGTPYVKWDQDQTFVSFRYKKAEALFYALCINKMMTREAVMRLFWPDNDEKTARNRLRDILYSLRKTLGEDTILAVGNGIIELNPLANIVIDTDNITKNNVVEAYKGDFLDCFYIKNCLEFEEWVEGRRKHYKAMYVHALKERIKNKSGESLDEELQRYITLISQNDVYSEQTYREMMQLYISLGQYNQAIMLYNMLEQILERDLGEKPERKTTELFEQIMEMREYAQHTPQEAAPMFWGRDTELYTATHCLSGLSEDAGKPVLLVGEAGVGKTALFNQTLRILDNSRYLIIKTTCFQNESSASFCVWYDLLAQLNGLLHAPFEQPVAHENMNEGWFLKALEALFAQLTANNPGKKIVLAIDDLQWMDAASQRVLLTIIRKCNNRSMSFLLCCRNHRQPNMGLFMQALEKTTQVLTITLERFTKAQTAQFACAWLPELKDRPGILYKIYKDTEGNALFLTQLLETIRDKGYQTGLSAKVVNMIQERFLVLSQQEQEVLCTMALFFKGVTLEEMLACGLCTDEAGVFRAVEALLAQQFIKEELAEGQAFYCFTHEKIRLHIHCMQPVGKRRILHRKIAAYYEGLYSQTPTFHLRAKLIYHYNACGDVYQSCIYKIEYLTEFYAVYHETYPYMSASYEDIGNPKPETSSSQQLLQLASEIKKAGEGHADFDLVRMKTDFLLGRYYIRLGDYEHGLAYINHSMAYARQKGDLPYLLNNFKQMIYYGIQINDLQVMLDYIVQAEELLPLLTGHCEERCLFIRLRGLYELKKGQYAKAKDTIWKAVAQIQQCNSYDEMFVAVCYNYIGECYECEEDYAHAFEYFEKAIHASETQPKAGGLGVFYSCAGRTLYKMQRYAEAKGYILQAIECFHAFNALWGLATAEAYAALIELHIGTKNKAVAHYQLARKTAKRIGNPTELHLVSVVGEELLKTYQKLI